MKILKKALLVAGFHGSLSLSTQKFDFTYDHHSW